jgi:hypothetical protein
MKISFPSFRLTAISACTILSVLALGASRSGAQVLLNGSFEDPAETSLTSGGGTDWTPTGDAFLVPNSAGYGETPYGTQYLGLNGYEDVVSSDAQVISGFTAGENYFLGVDFAGLLGGDPSDLELTLAGAYTYSNTFTATSNGPYGSTDTIPFTSATVFFTASASGSVTLTLTSVGPGTIAVDNIALYDNVAAIPEPTSFAAALMAFGGLAGAMGYRRVRRA